ncbi:helical backbone metal receptor [Undibacterium sp.]|jgi:ABC-type Fe3+-hydroxamate transport system substrate-binding protein|uniref:helical backbone metal receptor n=1 Tax=Undibacterium sp. TaxID=1914977 RepID=UPI002BEE3BC4|nr:helical backbone metal receptor [Undibacterium sp.]HTD04813.1 helical backbone metal receptor [Undibacterium sp.]
MTHATGLLDALGQPHAAVSGEPVRIVSLVPSITELVCDLGLAPYLVGRTGFCIHPAALVKNIPKIGGTKDVNIEKIRKLAPTHLIVNIDENEKPTVDKLAEFIPHIIVTHPIRPADNLPLYALLGGIFNVRPKAQQLAAQFERARQELPLPIRPQTVLYCIWKDPWMSVARDTYIANMLDLIGWKTWQSPSSDKRYPVFEWSDGLLHSIDAVLLSSEPYRFTEEHVDALEKQIGKPVYLVDGELISWYGSRAIQGLRYLGKLAVG